MNSRTLALLAALAMAVACTDARPGDSAGPFPLVPTPDTVRALSVDPRGGGGALRD